VEKLCQRFRDTSDEKQWRNIAFCLSLLPFKSERSLKKLIEALPFYQDKLKEETVFNRFNEILQKVNYHLWRFIVLQLRFCVRLGVINQQINQIMK
jgi:hypothetical protein